MYCEAPDCDRPAFRLGLCEAHCKRKQRGKPLAEPIAEQLSPKRRALEASIDLVEAGDDDREYAKRERAWLAAVRGYGSAARGELISMAMAEAKARGVRIGRPPKVTAAMLRELLSVSGLARLLQVDRKTIRRALRAHGEKRGISPQGAKRP